MITSVNNDKIKNVIKLLTNSKARRMQQAFVVEGERIVSEIPPGRILECFVSESFAKEKQDFLLEISDYEVVDDNIFRKMADTQNPQGILCVVKMEQRQLTNLLSEHTEGSLHLLLLEGIQDPGNMGTMIRTAEGAGFDAVISDRNTVDIYNPKVVRSTMGSMFRVPVVYTDDFINALDLVKSYHVYLYAAHLNGKNNYFNEHYPDRCAIMIGNEGKGLSKSASDMADVLVKIPMKGQLESLNASVAAALLMYEVGR